MLKIIIIITGTILIFILCIVCAIKYQTLKYNKNNILPLNATVNKPITILPLYENNIEISSNNIEISSNNDINSTSNIIKLEPINNLNHQKLPLATEIKPIKANKIHSNRYNN